MSETSKAIDPLVRWTIVTLLNADNSKARSHFMLAMEYVLSRPPYAKDAWPSRSLRDLAMCGHCSAENIRKHVKRIREKVLPYLAQVAELVRNDPRYLGTQQQKGPISENHSDHSL